MIATVTGIGVVGTIASVSSRLAESPSSIATPVYVMPRVMIILRAMSAPPTPASCAGTISSAVATAVMPNTYW